MSARVKEGIPYRHPSLQCENCGPNIVVNERNTGRYWGRVWIICANCRKKLLWKVEY
jgi:DNA-directed RNA polymerase subunit RPC12/RpoP